MTPLKKSTSIKQSSHVGNGSSAFGVLQIALVSGFRGVNYTIGVRRSSVLGRKNLGRVISRVKDESSIVERTNYFIGRYKIAISHFQFIPYTYRMPLHIQNKGHAFVRSARFLIYIDSLDIEILSQMWSYTILNISAIKLQIKILLARWFFFEINWRDLIKIFLNLCQNTIILRIKICVRL